mmetsp:Transcript_18054/g.50174  ORF Transcript_18054/g.50174 Transcript_18054/m.50174 type:complete len:398 (+) Transcript_18054:404-1597(+)
MGAWLECFWTGEIANRKKCESIRCLFSNNHRSVLVDWLFFVELSNTVLPVLGTLTLVERIIESRAAAIVTLGSLGFLVFYRKHCERDLGSVDALATNLDGIVSVYDIGYSPNSSDLKGGNVNKTVEASLAFAVQCAGIDFNEGTEVNGADNSSLNHGRLVPSLFTQGAQNCAVVSASLSAVVSSSLAARRPGSSSFFLGHHTETDLSLSGVDLDDADIDLLSLGDDFADITDESSGKLGNVQQTIGGGTNVDKGTVGGDRLYGSLHGGSLGKFAEVLAGRLFLFEGRSGGALQVVGLIGALDSFHGLDLGRDGLFGDIGEELRGAGTGALGARASGTASLGTGACRAVASTGSQGLLDGSSKLLDNQSGASVGWREGRDAAGRSQAQGKSYFTEIHG